MQEKKMKKSKFYEKIKVSTVERQVEDCYIEGIAFYFKEEDGSPIKFAYPYGCDGLIETKTSIGKMLKLLMEYKFDLDFTNKVVRARVITQVLFYMKRFEVDGFKLPNVILVGDINECFVFHSNDIIKYLDRDINWKTAASSAADKNPDLVMDIANDENLNPFVFVVDEKFSFKMVADKIKDLADNVQRYVHVTEHNISNIFDYFTTRVVKNVKNISPNDIVAIFIGIITNSDEYYKHPKKENIIVTPFGNIQIDAGQYKGFVSYFKRNYTPQEKMRFSEISDRLIEDTNRRNKGEFYTPTLFVDYAHKMISEQLGENWKDEYVVYDNCCGTKNLTRDYRFKELYCSTLEEAELELSKKYNPESVSFQFDFLNDYIPMPDDLDIHETKIPQGLLEAFKQNKKIVFFLNPPYATANNIEKDGSSKKGVAKTLVNKLMHENKIGAASQNLYAQFLYRITLLKKAYKLTNAHICIFCPTLYLTGVSWKGFRKAFLSKFLYKNGIQFKASHFADVADNWGITFSIWDCGETHNKNDFKFALIDNVDEELCIIEHKNIYNVDGLKEGLDWVKEDVKRLKTEDAPQLSSGLTCKQKGVGRIVKNALGYYSSGGNNVYNNQTDVYIVSCASSRGHGTSILPINFTKVCTHFAARKLIESTWMNSKDEYLAPNETHPQWNEYVNDSVIYSLFNVSSNQSSLRNITYHDKQWNIKNEFFWMSKEELQELANEYHNDDCYTDAHTAEERFVYNYIKEHRSEFSEEALRVLNAAEELVRKTFKYRELFNDEHPEYQINNWDCGFYQIKALAKQYAPDDLKAFRELYKKLSDKMRPMVYELGFLRK